jgi:hypothetical protein
MSRYISQTIHLYSHYRPANKEELFNLRHPLARNVIKRIFGVLKQCFRILLLAPEYSLEIQAQIPAALATIHNFIHSHDPDDDDPQTANDNITHDNSSDEAGLATVTIEEEVDERWDRIAQAMWDDYWQVCEERGIGLDDSDNDSDDEIKPNSDEDS